MWRAAALYNLFQRARHALAGQACVHFQGETLARNRAHDCQHANAPACRQCIRGKVECPFLVGSMQVRQQSCRPAQTLSLQTPDSKAFAFVHTVDALRTAMLSSAEKQSMQSPVAVAWLLSRQVHQLFSQLRIVIRHRFVPIAAPIHVHELAGPAFAHSKLLNSECHIAPQTGKLQPFFLTIAFSTSLSKLRSATKCFNRRFSSSRLFSRRASLTSRPPYLLFQV